MSEHDPSAPPSRAQLTDPSVHEPMHPRAAELIAELRLEPHPEGGHFRRIFRSARVVQPTDARPPRPALTTIYYLLLAGEHSRWHRVASDEVWHFYEGSPLELFWVDEEEVVREATITSGAAGSRPVAVVPANCWQAARSSGAFTLVGCTVGPGFDFDDFEMAGPTSADLERLRHLASTLPNFF